MGIAKTIRPEAGFPFAVQVLSLTLSFALLAAVLFQPRIHTALKLVLLAVLYAAYWVPKPLFGALQLCFDRKEVLFSFPAEAAHVQGGKPLLGLTIDDGPAWEFDKSRGPKCSTEQIRAALNKHKARATWFIIGSHVREDRGEILKSLVSDGHELANHGMEDRPAARLPREEFVKDTKACQKLIEGFGGGAGGWYRPGHAVFTRFRKKWLVEHGYRLAIGSIYPHDALDIPPLQFPFPRLIAWVLTTKAAPGDVLIVHDRPWTPKVLELALPYLAERFTICTLSELDAHCGSKTEPSKKMQSEKDRMKASRSPRSPRKGPKNSKKS